MNEENRNARIQPIIDFADTARKGNSPMATRGFGFCCRRLLRGLGGLAALQALGAAIAIIVFLAVVGSVK